MKVKDVQVVSVSPLVERVRATITKSGKDEVFTDAELADILKVSTKALYTNHKFLLEFILQHKRTRYWGRKEALNALQRRIDEQD